MSKKKIINTLASIRQGKIHKIDELLIDENYKGFVSVALAELEAFRGNWTNYQEYFRDFFPLNFEAWHSFNIPNEHIKLFILSSFYLNNEAKSFMFLKDMLKIFESKNIPFNTIIFNAIAQLENINFKTEILTSSFTPISRNR